MTKCTWPIACNHESHPQHQHCIEHLRAQGIRPEKEKKQPTPIAKVSEKKKADTTEKERKERLKIFFDDKIGERPDLCLNCDAELIESMFPNPRQIVAHILAKAHYKSVDTHDDNFLYLCLTCHNRFDLQTERFMKESKIAPLIKDRVQILIPLLTKEEKARLPEWLL